MEENNSQQELNIFTLFRVFFNFTGKIIKKILLFVGYLLQITYKYKYLLLVFIAVAIGYSLYTTQSSNKIYKADLMLDLNDGSSFLYSEMVASLNQFIKDEDPEGLAAILQIPQENAKKVAFLDSYFFIDMNRDSTIDLIDYEKKFQVSDTMNIKIEDKIIISVGMRDLSFFPEMEKAILNYFYRNDYLTSLNLTRITLLEEKEKLFNKNLIEIDSLQKIEYFEKKDDPGIKLDPKLLIRTDKQMFYFNKLDLLKKKEEVSKELASKFEIISVVSKFQPTTKPVNTLGKEIVKNSVRAFCIFLMLALLVEYRKKIMIYLTSVR